MAENQHSENVFENQASPFDAPAIAELAVVTTKREPLSTGGIIAWAVIVLVMAAMIILTAISRSGEEAQTEATSSDLFPVQLQARSIVGQKSFFGGSIRAERGAGEDDDNDSEGEDKDSKDKDKDKESEDKEDIEAKESEEGKDNDYQSSDLSGPLVPDELNDGTYEQRLCYVLLINENNGPDEAAKKLSELDDKADQAGFEMNEDQEKLRYIVGTVIESHQQGDMDAEPLTDDERELLKTKLGWVGQLALAPEGTRNKETRKELLAEASWSMGVMITAVVLGLLTLMSGVALAALFAVLFGTRKLTPKFMTRGKSTNIYIETFALWMVVFFVGPQLVAVAIRFSGIEMSTAMDMLMGNGFFLGSLLVLIYPVMRGISFKQLREDIGWTAKEGFVDIFVSPINYIAGTPLMFCGMICVIVLTMVASLFVAEKPFGTGVAAGHPIQDVFAGGEWFGIATMIFMACIAAPIVEETMFRGVLYRHLRELSANWARWGSVIFSAVFNGLIFAAIHPQGFVAIPLLTCLAISFSLTREWRDSLIAPMIMHGINNGAVTAMMLLMM